MSARAEISEGHVASFQAVRPRLFGIAYRVLGSADEADDVVQDAWLRWQGTDRSVVRYAPAFLAAATTRLAINVTQSARARHETHADTWLVERVDAEADPAHEVERTEALGHAVVALGEALRYRTLRLRAARSVRLPYRQIADVLATSEPNARQLAARARLDLAGEPRRQVSAAERRRFLDAFLDAAQTGDLTTLEHVLTGDLDASHPISIAAYG